MTGPNARGPPDPLHRTVFRPGRAGLPARRSAQTDTSTFWLLQPLLNLNEIWYLMKSNTASQAPTQHYRWNPEVYRINALGPKLASGKQEEVPLSLLSPELQSKRSLLWGRTLRGRQLGAAAPWPARPCSSVQQRLTALCHLLPRCTALFPHSHCFGGAHSKKKTWLLILTLCLFSGKLKLEFSCVFNFCVYV